MVSDSKTRLALRQRGYTDGLVGRKALTLDADYQAGWRRGQERRLEISKPVRAK